MMLQDANDLFVDDLRDPRYAAGYLNIALEDDGVEGFLHALQKVARAHGISKVAAGSNSAREALYRALSDKGNPGIRSLARILGAVGLRLSVLPSIPAEVSSVAANEVSDLEVSDLEVSDLYALVQAQQKEMAQMRAQVQRLTHSMEQLVGVN